MLPEWLGRAAIELFIIFIECYSDWGIFTQYTHSKGNAYINIMKFVIENVDLHRFAAQFVLSI